MTTKFPLFFQIGVATVIRLFMLGIVSCGISFLHPLTTLAESTDTRSGADVLPASVVLYAELAQPAPMIEQLIAHPLRHRLESSQEYKEAILSDGFKRLRRGVKMFEAGMEEPWDQAIANLIHQGVFVAVDGQTKGIVLLTKADSSETAEKLYQIIDGIGQLSPETSKAIQRSQYRDVSALRINDKFRLVQHNEWLMVTNNSDLGKNVIDRLLDDRSDSLAKSKQFVSARETKIAGNIWAFADIQNIRESGVAPKLYSGISDNPLAEILIGGILSNLQHTSHATMTLGVRMDGIHAVVAAPHNINWEEGREFFFGETSTGTAPPMFKTDDTLFVMSAHRDLSQMWLRAGDLMTEQANDSLAKADAQLTTVFSGKDFGEDILGAIQPDLQLIVNRQDFANVVPRPAIKLPAFALHATLKNPEKTQDELRRVFQSLVGFINIVGAMQGQPQLDLGMESLPAGQLVTSTYVPDQNNPEDTAAPINYNFSPSIAFVGDRVILSSSAELARKLVEAKLESGVALGEGGSHGVTNTQALLKANLAKQILADNREILIAQNMLEKGHGREKADQEIATLLKLVDLIDQVSATFNVSPDELRFEMRADFALGQ